jgi:1-phosphatidylinositol-4-phosphate 5-kinase
VKDYSDGRPLTPAKDYSPNSIGGLRRPISRASLDKELPPIPQVTSPVEMSEKDPVLR